jgi:hypothetical protein
MFRPDDGVDYTIHAQCPFRVMHGSYDMHWPKVRGADSDEAFESFTTMYDVRAESLTTSFAEGDFRMIVESEFNCGYF